MNHVSNVLIAALSIALLLSSCLESKKDYEFVPGWYEDSSRITSPPDASHGYFEIYYIANGKRCLADDRARTMRDLGDGCIVYPTDSVQRGFLRAQCVGRMPLLIQHEWDRALENSPKRLIGPDFDAWKARARRQPAAPCLARD